MRRFNWRGWQARVEEISERRDDLHSSVRTVLSSNAAMIRRSQAHRHGLSTAALRSFVGLTQAGFARAIEISVHTLRNWEQGRRRPEGPEIALLRIAARHPRISRENLESAASCRAGYLLEPSRPRYAPTARFLCAERWPSG
jgi:putative transcriptional regulator